MIHDFILHFRAWAFSRPNADLDRTFDIIQAKLKSISEREDGLGQSTLQASPHEPTILPRQDSSKSLELCACHPDRAFEACIVTVHCLVTRSCYIGLFG